MGGKSLAEANKQRPAGRHDIRIGGQKVSQSQARLYCAFAPGVGKDYEQFISADAAAASECLSTEAIAAAVYLSTASPVGWPYVSLSILKSSRSMVMTDSSVLLRCALNISAARRLWIPRR